MAPMAEGLRFKTKDWQEQQQEQPEDTKKYKEWRANLRSTENWYKDEMLIISKEYDVNRQNDELTLSEARAIYNAKKKRIGLKYDKEMLKWAILWSGRGKK